jgi:Skp family chaperone for outer membrane proteins
MVLCLLRGGRMGILAALAFACAPVLPAHAEEAPVIIVVDQERLFQESLFGNRIAQELEERTAELAAENRKIETELIAEERDLTERRPSLEPAEFRTLADAFDAKVERLRAEQDAKTRDLVELRDTERQNFTRTVGPILLDYMRETGAAVMVDRRSVVATSDRVDVTDKLIAEINARVGAGEAVDIPGPANDGAAAPDQADSPEGLSDGSAFQGPGSLSTGTVTKPPLAPDTE